MSVGRDTGLNLAAALGPIIIALVVTPFYLHAIGPDRFGILAICWTILGALGFASAGMGPAVTYRLALMDEEDPLDRSNQVWVALVIGFTASLVGALLVLVAARSYFLRFASLPRELKTEISTALPLLAALLPIGTLAGILNGALQGRKRFDALSSVNIFNAAVSGTAPLVAALLIGHTLPILLIAVASANMLVLLAQLAVCTRVVPLRFPLAFGGEHMKALLGYGAWMSAAALIAPILLLLDRLVIGVVRGPTAVAVYVLAFNLMQGLLLLPASLSSAMLPQLAPLTSEEDVKQLQSDWLLWLSGLMTPAVIITIAFSAPFLRLWVGSALGSASSPVATILFVGCWFHGIGHIASAVLVGRHRPQVMTKLLFLCLLPYVLTLYFVTLRFGVVGAASVWTARSACDLFLFSSTNPRRADLRSVSLSALFVVCALVIALALDWTSAFYWVGIAAIISAACLHNRDVLASSVHDVRKMVARAM